MKALKRGNSSQSEAAKDRAHMVEFNASMLDAAIRSWAADGKDVGDAVVLLVDITDPLGASIVQSADPALYERGIATAQPRTKPTVTMVMNRDGAANGMVTPQPNIATSLRSRPTDGYFWVCCVGFGGATLRLREIQVPEEGQGIGDA